MTFWRTIDIVTAKDIASHDTAIHPVINPIEIDPFISVLIKTCYNRTMNSRIIIIWFQSVEVHLYITSHKCRSITLGSTDTIAPYAESAHPVRG